MPSLFHIPETLDPAGPEFFENLLEGTGPLRVERIISHGHTSPEGFWYDQAEDEWVTVLEGAARILFEDGRETPLQKGDTLFLPKRTKHRVTDSSSPCIWLAIFAENLEKPR